MCWVGGEPSLKGSSFPPASHTIIGHKSRRGTTVGEERNTFHHSADVLVQWRVLGGYEILHVYIYRVVLCLSSLLTTALFFFYFLRK